MELSCRKARPTDHQVLKSLIRRSARDLQVDFYSPSQIEAALGPVFGVDEQMIDDSTYYIVERNDLVIGCGGWSFRESLYGGRTVIQGNPRRLDPETEPARIRAFFVDPDFARMGVGSHLMRRCEEDLFHHGFRRAEISATLVGEPLYLKFGFRTTGRYEIELIGASPLPVLRMEKIYERPPLSPDC